MYVATSENVWLGNGITDILPLSLRKYMYGINLEGAEEIRIAVGNPVFVHFADGNYCLTRRGILSRECKNAVIAEKKHLDEIMERITGSSIYSVRDKIKNGYITVNGGHRIGLCGTAVVSDKGIEFIKNISALNIRIASEHIGISEKVMESIMEPNLKNTIIISPPGCGKTTLLRDIVRNLSQRGYCVGVADERCEIAGMRDGKSSFELGPHTVVLENCPKPYAMQNLLRAMSPQVIATDEIGTEEDADAVLKLINSGVKVLATVHGENPNQVKNRYAVARILPYFETAVTLSKKNGTGTVESAERLQ